jgi:hypothetical protein
MGRQTSCASRGERRRGWVSRRSGEPTKTGTPNLVVAPKYLVGWRRRHPHLRSSTPEPITVGGIEAVRFDLAVDEDLLEGYGGICGTGCAEPAKFADGRVLGQPKGKGLAGSYSFSCVIQ